MPETETYIPDFEVVLKMVCAHLEARGQTYVEIAYDPKTKEIGWSFTPVERNTEGDPSRN